MNEPLRSKTVKPGKTTSAASVVAFLCVAITTTRTFESSWAEIPSVVTSSRQMSNDFTFPASMSDESAFKSTEAV